MWSERGQGDSNPGRWEGGALVWEQLPLAVMGAGQGTWKAVGRQWQACWGQGLGWGRGGWGGHWAAPSCLEWSLQALGQIPRGRHWEEAGGSLG